MSRKGRIVGSILFLIIGFVFVNAIVVPALQAPIKKDISICDQKMALADQRALALDHNDQLKYDELTAQYDSIKGC